MEQTIRSFEIFVAFVPFVTLMRHLKKGRTFGRTQDQRRALLRALAHGLVMRERITTTEAKAKELRPVIEKMVSRAKSGTLASRRLLLQRLPAAAVRKLADAIAPRLKDRRGGYTRIIKLPPRRSDASRMAIIEFVK